MPLAKMLTALRMLDDRVVGRRLRKLRRLFAGDLRQMSIDLASVCNIECSMCSLKAFYPHPARTLKLERLKKLDWAFKRLQWVDLQCNCEPLLNKNIVPIVEHIRSINPKIKVAFVTNGMLLTREKSAALVESGVSKIGISVDGACAETFERIRVGARFDTVLAHVKGLVEERARQRSKTPIVEIMAVASRENVHELVGIVELAHALGAEAVGINGLEPYSADKADQILYAAGEPQQEYVAVFDEVRATAARLGLSVRLPSLAIEPYSTCEMQCVVDALGNVHPCPTLSYERPYYYLGEPKKHPRVCFGNVEEKSFEEIWRSEEYERFRARGIEGNLPDCCSSCLYKNGVTCPSGRSE